MSNHSYLYGTDVKWYWYVLKSGNETRNTEMMGWILVFLKFCNYKTYNKRSLLSVGDCGQQIISNNVTDMNYNQEMELFVIL